MALCPAADQRLLRDFAYNRFRRYAALYAHTTNTPEAEVLTPPPAEAWHWFETYLRIRNTRAGKSYKEWLFARAGDATASAFDRIQGGATLLMRDVVREHLRREYSARWVVALDAPAKTDGGAAALDLATLLPGTADTAGEVERRELEAIAATEIAGTIAALTTRERIALCTRELGLSLAHPMALQAAGCGKSMLNAAYRRALQGIAAHIRARYPREELSTVALLTALVFDKIRAAIIVWGKSEKTCAHFFSYIDGKQTEP